MKNQKKDHKLQRDREQIIRVGLIQMSCEQRLEENVAKSIFRIKKLAKKGARIICLPELFKTPYFCQIEDPKFFDWAEWIPGPTTRALGTVAKEEKVVIITSIFEKEEREKFFNTAVIIDADGKLCGRYRKIHIPNDLKNHYAETYYFEQGDLGFQSFKTQYATIGALICYDQWFPEGARVVSYKGAQILFYPTAIGWPLNDKRKIRKAEYEAWQIIQRSHAIANNVFVVVVNRVGLEQELKFWGTSFVSDPYGQVIAKAPSTHEKDLVVDCDLSLISQMRKDWPFLTECRIKCEEVKHGI